MSKTTGHILVVDDNEPNRDILTRRLTHAGHTVDQAGGGRQALNLIGQNEYDLILLDVMMPEICGLDVLQEVRKSRTLLELPVIMVTARSESEQVVEAINLGANDYVTKPIDWPVVRARTQAQLQLRKMAQLKDQFLRIASHDLKNPLQCIMGSASILLTSMAEPGTVVTDELYTCMGMISDQARVMMKIISDFLDFQAMEAGSLKLQFDMINLNEAARFGRDRNRDYADGKDIALRLDLDSSLEATRMDRSRIFQVVDNFVSNAIKFNEKGGEVTIRTRNLGQAALLEVLDNGPGLTEEDMEKLFVKYARLSNKPTGGEKSSGLGLAICKELIEAHGGQIGADNNPEGGAVFWIQIPSVAQQEGGGAGDKSNRHAADPV